MKENRIPKIGDRVKVIAEICDHEFRLGEVVEVVGESKDKRLDKIFMCVNEEGEI